MNIDLSPWAHDNQNSNRLDRRTAALTTNSNDYVRDFLATFRFQSVIRKFFRFLVQPFFSAITENDVNVEMISTRNRLSKDP